jgi:hypothetical protein
MTWLTWRQFRAQAAIAIGALAAFAILLAATGPHLASLYGASGISSCRGGSCGQLASNFLIGLGPGYPFVYLLGLAGVVLAPAVIGIFWALPSSPASSRLGRSGWPGPRASPALDGWPSSSR